MPSSSSTDHTSTATATTLPPTVFSDDVLFIILQFLDHQTTLRVCGKICQQWRRIAETQNLKIMFEPTSQQAMERELKLLSCGQLACMTDLKMMRCYNFPQQAAIVFSQSANYERLRRLDLTENQLKEDVALLLLKTNMKRLRFLDLSKNMIGGEGLKVLGECCFPNLSHLNCSNNTAVSAEKSRRQNSKLMGKFQRFNTCVNCSIFLTPQTKPFPAFPKTNIWAVSPFSTLVLMTYLTKHSNPLLIALVSPI